ncbi:MAG TPA: hypothetical protein VJY39_09200 [Acidisphaera sp.]|nr:hypothetical protein [Acidisphaera sp.]
MDLNHESTDVRPLVRTIMNGLSRRLARLGDAIVRALARYGDERPFGGF